MQLFPDIFDGLGTIKNAVVRLDVKPDATAIVCSPRRVPDSLRLIKGRIRQNGVYESYQKTGHK